MASETVLFSYLKAYRCIFTTSRRRRRRRSAPLQASARPCRLPNPDRHTYNPKHLSARALAQPGRPTFSCGLLHGSHSTGITQVSNHDAALALAGNRLHFHSSNEGMHANESPTLSSTNLSRTQVHITAPSRSTKKHTQTQTHHKVACSWSQVQAKGSPTPKEGSYASSC